MTIEFAPEADDDLANALQYLAERNLAAALDLDARLMRVMDQLAAVRIYHQARRPIARR